MGLLEKCLRKLFSHKEIGWKEIGETFTRFSILCTPWFRIYLHKLDAPNPHPQCHDHPWNFIAFILKGGYWEFTGDKWHWRGPASLLYRPAKFRHNVVTKGVSWSVIFTTRKVREWGMMDDCRTRP